jgi:predicted nuclease with TOPRIM domain
MATFENVKLLESKVIKVLDVVKQLIDENKQLKEKLTSYQNQINELEFLVLGFKEDQQHIETSILSALDRLNQFEDSIGKGLAPLQTDEEIPIPVKTHGNGEAVHTTARKESGGQPIQNNYPS